MKKTEKLEKINKILEKFEEIEFKPEGLGALEFSKEIFTKNFKIEKINFRIERVSMQVANRLGTEKDELAEVMKALKTFIAQPYDARDVNFYEMDYEAMTDILELVSAFQETPFLFTNRARAAEGILTD